MVGFVNVQVHHTGVRAADLGKVGIAEAAAHLCSTAPIFNFSLHTGVTALDHAGDNGMALTGAFQVSNHFTNGTTGVQFT